MSAIYTPTSPTLLTSPALPHLQLSLQRVLNEAGKTPGGRGREGDIEKFLRLHAAEFDRVLLTLDMAFGFPVGTRAPGASDDEIEGEGDGEGEIGEGEKKGGMKGRRTSSLLPSAEIFERGVEAGGWRDGVDWRRVEDGLGHDYEDDEDDLAEDEDENAGGAEPEQHLLPPRPYASLPISGRMRVLAASDRLQGVVGRGMPVSGPRPGSRAVEDGGGSATVADAVDQTPTDDDDDEDDGSDTPRQRGFAIGSSLLRGQSPVD